MFEKSFVRTGHFKQFILLQLFLMLVLLCGRMYAGDIHGKVIIRKPSLENSTIVSRSIIRKYVKKMTNSYQMDRGVRGEPTDVVIYIDGLKMENDAQSKIAVMDQTGEKFVPHVLPILVGSKVKFLNSDDVYHNVFSFSSAKSFDLGRYANGDFRYVTFRKPGVVNVYCDIHTHMNAFILVLTNPFFVQPDAHGEFMIKDVPAGTYTLKAWYGRTPELSKKITLKQGTDTEVNFLFK